MKPQCKTCLLGGDHLVENITVAKLQTIDNTNVNSYPRNIIMLEWLVIHTMYWHNYLIFLLFFPPPVTLLRALLSPGHSVRFADMPGKSRKKKKNMKELTPLQAMMLRMAGKWGGHNVWWYAIRLPRKVSMGGLLCTGFILLSKYFTVIMWALLRVSAVFRYLSYGLVFAFFFFVCLGVFLGFLKYNFV